MGKGKKKSGGGAAAALAGPAMASDETLGSETLDAIEARHELELAEVKRITADMTGKKDAMRVLHIEGEVTDRHYLEMRRWEELHHEEEEEEEEEEGEVGGSRPDPSSSRPEASSDLETRLAATGLHEPDDETRGSPPSDTTMTKAMRRRLKKEREEREREERVAREVAEARAAGPSAGEAESAKLSAVLRPFGLRVREIKADGHCLYRAVADQLAARAPARYREIFEIFSRSHTRDAEANAPGDAPVSALRALAARVMRADADAYRPFLETGAAQDDDGWSRYLADVESTAAWGGQLELQALAVGLKTPIEVFTADAPPVTMGEAFAGEARGVALRVCHHRHAFGLGEHYNSAADA